MQEFGPYLCDHCKGEGAKVHLEQLTANHDDRLQYWISLDLDQHLSHLMAWGLVMDVLP
jgi:hypothetical protein